jgi:CRISPR-associated protein, CT1132 family
VALAVVLQRRAGEKQKNENARIKRTIRDTLQEMGEEIFIREERKEDGTLKKKEDLANEYGGNILERCIDIRLFGGTFALKTGKTEKRGKTEKSENLEPFSLTGPVQFAYGTSLHRVKILEVQGTSVLPSSDEKGKGKKQGTMMFDYRVAYALIGVYGVANQKTAKETNLTDEDFEKMLKALWIGHRGGSVLITGSKLGHKSLLLLDIVHTEDSLDLIGSLDRYVKIKLNAEINDEEAIRSPKDYILDISELGEKVKALKGRNRLEKVRYILDEDLRVEPSIEKAFEGINLEKLEF